MEKVDFSKCRFIKERMWFYTFQDFCDNRKIIKRYFNELDRDGKLFYMWYVYANVNIDEMRKNRIWDYLNSDEVQYEMLLVHNTKK
jgi:DNA integrity scanning protein DisA with diadenylate cyclase activity